jgi:hypothetical protein
MNVSLRDIIIKIFIPSFVICYLSFVISPAPVQAQGPDPLWSTYGLLVNDTPGNTTQQNPEILSGQDGCIMVWEDGRSGHFDIFAQKIDESGTPLWKKGGAAVCRSTGNQSFPQLASDGANGAIIVWQDYQRGNADIFAQRIDYAGNPLWGQDGVPVCTAAAGQFAPEIVSDGVGGAIITWHDYRGAAGEDVYAQRIDYKGAPLWEENGIAISSASGTQWYPKIASDGKEGAFIVWTDGRISSANNNIYGQHIDSSGKTLWEKNGISICSAAQNQELPVIIASDDGAIIAWNDSRSGNIDIYVQKVNSSGDAEWQKDGIAACPYPYDQENPVLSSDGCGGAILAWTDQRLEGSDIYAQRISSDGAIAWQTNGNAVCQSPGNQKNPRIVNPKTDKWIIVWEDDRKGEADLYAQKIMGAGTLLWKEGGILVASASHEQKSPAAASTAAGDLVVVWEDGRHGNQDIYSQKVSANGALLWGESGLAVCAAKGSVVQQNVKMILNAKDEIIIVFEDARTGFSNIYAQKITKSGELAWGYDGISIAKIAAKQINPHVVSDGAGGAVIAWEDYRLPDHPAIRAQRINSEGKKQWESSIRLAQVKSRQTSPVMISDDAGEAIIAWQDDRDVLSLQDIYVQRTTPGGTPRWTKKARTVISANSDQVDIVMVSDGIGGAILAWTDFREGERNPDIYSQRINSEGKMLWDEEGILICGAPDVQRKPKLIPDGEGGAIICWTDKGGGSYDIYAQRVDKTGKSIWAKDGIPISQLSRTQQNPEMGNKKILVWEDYRYGNWDIFAGAVDLSGNLLWGEKGSSVASVPHTQYAPQVATWNQGGAIIAWEDYRCGKNYDIYVQKLDENGDPAWAENGFKILTKEGGRTPQILADTYSSSFYVFWEDHADGGRAIYGQRFIAE